MRVLSNVMHLGKTFVCANYSNRQRRPRFGPVQADGSLGKALGSYNTPVSSVDPKRQTDQMHTGHCCQSGQPFFLLWGRPRIDKVPDPIV